MLLICPISLQKSRKFSHTLFSPGLFAGTTLIYAGINLRGINNPEGSVIRYTPAPPPAALGNVERPRVHLRVRAGCATYIRGRCRPAFWARCAARIRDCA